MIKFSMETHEKNFYEVRAAMSRASDFKIGQDPYRNCVAYLISLDRVVYEHRNDIFNFNEGLIIPEGLHHGWQTGSSRKTSRLIFNLWNGYCYDNKQDESKPSRYYSVEDIFSVSEYAPYYWEAVKLRFFYN